MTYEPGKNSQIDGTKYAPVNCVPATCVMGADRATVGTKRVKTAAIRTASGDTSGGMTYADAVEATAKVTGVRGAPRYSITRADLRTLLKAGHAVTISIDCSVTVKTPYRTNSYTGGHSVFVNFYSAVADTFTIEDPGTTSAGYLRWPAQLLYAAAEKRTNGHGINVIVWPDTEGVSRKCVMKGRIRKSPSVGSADLGPLVVGKAYAVLSTVNGGPWLRDDGTTAYGWHRINGGYVAGERLR